MIEEMLNPPRVELAVNRLLEETRTEQRLLESDDSEAKGRAGDSQGSKEDLEGLEGELEKYKTGEAEDLSGASTQPIWIPRDPITALIQSTYDEFFEEFDLVHETDGGQALEGEVVPVSKRVLDAAAIDFLQGRKRLFGRWLTRFGQRDPRFLSWWAAAKVKTRMAGKHDFPKSASPPYGIGEKDRVLLVGDWGSGIHRARQVATAMRMSMLQAIAEGRRCHVIHLGDVYYSGQKSEYKKRFLEPWPVWATDPEAQTSSWCLNANHDMYSGGTHYFDYLLKDPRFKNQGGSSYFSLENKYWQILGLDSAYDDGDLHGEQAAWVYQMRMGAPDKAGILLTHHQPFSSYEQASSTMLNRLRPVLNAGKVRAWFWGHEHRCAFYETRENVAYPRLIGHGGVPVLAPGSRPAKVTYQYGDKDTEYFYRFGREKFLRFGFAELTFDDKDIVVRYLTELAGEAKSEVLHKES